MATGYITRRGPGNVCLTFKIRAGRATCVWASCKNALLVGMIGFCGDHFSHLIGHGCARKISDISIV